MEIRYTDNKTVQIIIALLKGHGIKNVVISPGTTNIMFVASVQNDPWFEIRSAADERSAAYIACGWAAETGKGVVLSCTGATASRNYLPGLTEAFYRKLPVLAITSINNSALPGNNIPQVIDRSVVPNDVVKLSVNISEVHDETEADKCIVLANKALLELTRRGGGPAHINLATKMNRSFNTKELPRPRVIRRYTYGDTLPKISSQKSVSIFLGSHTPMSEDMTEKIDCFCSLYNAIVFCDHTSGYKGKYRFNSALIGAQEHLNKEPHIFDITIDLGEITGDYYSLPPKETWRVSSDGELRDRFGTLEKIFEMDEETFFERYLVFRDSSFPNCNSIDKLHKIDTAIRAKMPELPFSNIWIAQQMSNRLPGKSVVHFGILNSLRAWNFFEIPETVRGYCNVGGFGIDGDVSTLLGASFADDNTIYFGFVGDLAFFYDMNSLGNRHIRNNVRLLVVNNGKGTEFRNYSHPAAALGSAADSYIAAAGHYGNKSSLLLKHYAEDLGFEYMSASDKNTFYKVVDRFVQPEMTDKPLLFEAFTDSDKESEALFLIRHIIEESKQKKLVKRVLGDRNIKRIKNKLSQS